MNKPNSVDADKPFEPAEKVESFLVSFQDFGKSFLYTVRDLAFKQSKFSQTITNPGKSLGYKYIKPITFLTLLSFVT
ncbi:MAG: hypothetical protein AAF485_01150, partial [Chloroflexota bacterium]